MHGYELTRGQAGRHPLPSLAVEAAMDDVIRVDTASMVVLKDGSVMLNLAPEASAAKDHGASVTVVMPPEVAHRLARSLSCKLRGYVEDAVARSVP
jgi:hypothetical protein